MALFKIHKGLAKNLPTTYNEGYCYFTTDDGKFYIDTTDTKDGRKLLNPNASGTIAGMTIVYPAASCTTFSSDSGTITPLAAQKAAKMFAITRPSSSTNKAIVRYSNTTGDVQDSKIIIEDVTNSRDSSKKA